MAIFKHQFFAVLSITVIVLCSLSGCSTENDIGTANPYSAQFTEALATTDSDYVRHILSDGKIDESEIEDARHHVIECLSDAGIDMSYQADIYGDINLMGSGVLSGAQQATYLLCQNQWMGMIDQLYWEMYTNPNNENWNSLVAECLIRKSLAPAGFTGDDYATLKFGNNPPIDTSTMTPDSNGYIEFPMTSPEVLPGGAVLGEGEAGRCEALPLQ